MSWFDVAQLMGQLLCQIGPITTVIAIAMAFFIWRDWKRELRLQDRVEALEKDQQEVLLPMVEQCATVITQNTAVMLRLEKLLDRNQVEVQDERTMLDRLLTDAAAHRKDGSQPNPPRRKHPQGAVPCTRVGSGRRLSRASRCDPRRRPPRSSGRSTASGARHRGDPTRCGRA